MTALEKLILAAEDITVDVPRGQRRCNLLDAIHEARKTLKAHDNAIIGTVIDRADEQGWYITKDEARLALSACFNNPGAYIAQIVEFRDRSTSKKYFGGSSVTLKYAKEIVEIAREASGYGL